MSTKRYHNKHNTKSNPQKKVYKVKNWKKYNKALIKRGNITIWFTDDTIKQWFHSGHATQGAQRIYSDLAIKTLLTFRSLFSLPLRSTQGFALSLITLMKFSIAIPDYSTLSRRQSKLEIKDIFKCYNANEPIHIILDSTGLKVFGEGEWKVRRHGYTKHRMWRKLHIAIDHQGTIIQQELTTNSMTDSSAGKNMITSMEQPLASVTADAGYDTTAMYDACKKKKCKAIIRPQNNARIRTEKVFTDRNKNVSRIKTLGSRPWRLSSGYSKRSIVETTMFRYKTTFGDKPLAHTIQNQRTEVALNCTILNTFLKLGRPLSYQVTC